MQLGYMDYRHTIFSNIVNGLMSVRTYHVKGTTHHLCLHSFWRLLPRLSYCTIPGDPLDYTFSIIHKLNDSVNVLYGEYSVLTFFINVNLRIRIKWYVCVCSWIIYSIYQWILFLIKRMRSAEKGFSNPGAVLTLL